MSAGGLVAPAPSSASPSPSRIREVQELVQRFTPSQGWAMFLFLAAALLIVANSVTTANWIETPSLSAVLLWAALAGLLLSKVKAHAILLHIAGLAIGFVVVVWQTSSLIPDKPLVDQVPELWHRLQDWYSAAESGGISTDLLPFTLILVTASWLLGYISSWFIFRRSNPWVAVVISGVAILTNLSFLPNEFASRFFLFVFVAMLLIVRMSIIQKQEEWQSANVGYSQSTGWLTLHATVWFGLAIVILLGQFDGLGGAAAIAAVWGVWHLIAGGALVGVMRRYDV